MFSIFLPSFFNGFFVRNFYFDFFSTCFSKNTFVNKHLGVISLKLSSWGIILWENILFL